MFKWKEHIIEKEGLIKTAEWVTMGEPILARWLERKDIHGITKQDVIVNPGEAVLLLRDGKIEETLTQTRLEKMGGGFINWLAGKLQMGDDISVIFVDTRPFDLGFPVAATSKDYVEVKGRSTVRCQFNVDTLPKIINLFAKAKIKTDTHKGLLWDSWRHNPVLTETLLAESLRDELQAMVFAPAAARLNAEEFRGNVDAIKEMETDIMVELRKTFDMSGLNLVKSFTVWEPSAYDEMMTFRRQWFTHVQRYDGQAEAQNLAKLADMRREFSAVKQQQEQKWDLAYGDIYGEEGLKTVRVKSEMDRQGIMTDAKVSDSGKVFNEGARQSNLQTDVDKRRTTELGNADLDLRQRRLQQALDAKNQMVEQRVKQFQQTEMAASKQQQDYQMNQMALQQAAMERLMAQGLSTGAVDSAAMQEMLRQQTMQRMADRESEKVQALAGAEGQRYQLNAYTQGQQKDREFQSDVLGKSADMMQSAKPNAPGMYLPASGGAVLGGGTAPAPQHLSGDKAAKLAKLDEMFLNGQVSEETYKDMKARLQNS